MGSFSDDVETLRVWRENNDRKSREIVKIWLATVEENLDSLGKDKFVVIEQVCIAALDCNELRVAEKCIDLLYKAFPNSSRVKRLQSMFCEAEERYDEALVILDGLIKEDPTNSAAKKRKIAILKSQGKISEAVKELTDYLKTFMADTEAWQELSEIYISENDFNKAAFCVEELILHNPHNHLLHQRYADIKYTQGGQENIEIAKNYYCQALKLNPNNIRALYGLYLTGTHSSVSKLPQKKKEASKLADWSIKEIEKKYAPIPTIPDLNDRLAALDI
ncbi:ER membrane protein complex subunit 2 [Aethina tumida]|uniref:ER membrane protein complex subunit 2 n=1 Tax=Aethina tumida TaxID=116153 RepID=UPI00096B11E2|nr:ER membrane protein complex subunit 2 [Aethina tumida]